MICDCSEGQYMKVISLKGYQLAELLIVAAIIGVLVAASLHVYTDKLEESRDAVAVANIRTAYTRAMTEYVTFTANDSSFDYALNSYVIKEGDNIVGSINYRNGRIAQICIYNVEVPTEISNDWSGLGDNLPFYNTLASEDHGDQGVARKNATIEFDFDDYGAEHIGTGAVWDAHEAKGQVTSVVVRDTPEYIANRL